MEWVESININYRVANKFMNIAKELPNMTTSSNLSYEALYLITTLPEEKKQAQLARIEKGDTPTVADEFKRIAKETERSVKIRNNGYRLVQRLDDCQKRLPSGWI